MKTKALETIKSLAVGVGVIVLLQVTGIMGTVSGLTQSAMLEVGVLNAGDDPIKDPEAFDYNFAVRKGETEKINFDQYKGKVVFLNVWATWCGPCRREMPTIEALYKKMNTSGVEFVMLSVDRESDRQKIASYIDKYDYTFPVYRPSGYLTAQLNVPGIPTTFVIDKKGNIVSKEIGASNFDTPKFIRFLNKLLAEENLPEGK
jgi:thiol-disulfide isomerase/thioredoxin